MRIKIDRDSNTPAFQQLVEQIHFLINTHELKTGERLPSIRRLAEECGLAANTVAKAMRQLEFRGLVQAWTGAVLL
jgi:GntR family transcriptional regulator